MKMPALFGEEIVDAAEIALTAISAWPRSRLPFSLRPHPRARGQRRRQFLRFEMEADLLTMGKSRFAKRLRDTQPHAAGGAGDDGYKLFRVIHGD